VPPASTGGGRDDSGEIMSARRVSMIGRRERGLTMLVATAATVGLAACGGSDTTTSALQASSGTGTGTGAGTGTATATATNPDDLKLTGPLSNIKHIVVIYQENWSFDSLYGKFPGANGLPSTVTQVDKAGAPITSLPAALDNSAAPKPDTHIPAGLPVAPYDLNQYVPPDGKTGDLVHRYYQEQYQIDGGKNDKFLAWSDNPGLVLSYYDGANLPEGKLAQKYVLADNFFQSAFGGSFLNHQFLVCACAPKWDTTAAPIPTSKQAVLGPDGVMTTDGYITPDGHLVNTSYTVNTPHPASQDTPANKPTLDPNFTEPTIGDRLDAASISWKWYSGGWNNAVKGSPDTNFQFHHQPFAFYKSYADGTPAKAQHLQDEFNFIDDIRKDQLPAVSFIKPLGDDNEHPGYANEIEGQAHVQGLVAAIQQSPAWKDTAIFITYDEFGGRYDHVPPPVIDKFGPGNRVPLLIISPYAKRGVVNHDQAETVSLLAFIEKRFGLQPLTDRDAKANPLLSAFNFSS
jgi:acid phosphatase